ncbi:hypothetical protein BH09MYX1_BH09MYX1_26480 [soil metagenome]
MRRALVLFAASSLLVAHEAGAEERPTLDKAHRPPFAIQVTALFGDGVRFNNPYRLSTVLGSDAESVSRTASYVDFGAALLFGDPRGFLQGIAVRTSVAVEGIAQTVLTPSYQLFRRFGVTAAWARVGTPIILSQVPTWGLEGALGGALFIRAGIGITAELVFDAMFGVGTRESRITTYPIASAQLGFVFHYEVLP